MGRGTAAWLWSYPEFIMETHHFHDAGIVQGAGFRNCTNCGPRFTDGQIVAEMIVAMQGMNSFEITDVA